MEENERKYIPVYAAYDFGGGIHPLAIVWDGMNYKVERVLSIRKGNESKTRADYDRYSVVISGRERTLCLERDETVNRGCYGRWFVLPQ